MGLEPKIQEKYYDDYWNKIENCTGSDLDSFVRNYLTIETGVIPNIRNVYQAFKAFAKGKDIQQLLGQMLTYATAYKKLTTFDLGDSEANEIAKRLDLLDMTVAYPFLMAFMIYASETSIYEKELVPVLSCIESFIFRRLMCDLPTSALNKIFATLHKFVVKNKKETDRYSEVMIYYLDITLGDGSKVAGCSAAERSLPPGGSAFGTPGESQEDWVDRHMLPRKVRKLTARIEKLEALLAELQQKKN